MQDQPYGAGTPERFPWPTPTKKSFSNQSVVAWMSVLKGFLPFRLTVPSPRIPSENKTLDWVMCHRGETRWPGGTVRWRPSREATNGGKGSPERGDKAPQRT